MPACWSMPTLILPTVNISSQLRRTALTCCVSELLTSKRLAATHSRPSSISTACGRRRPSISTSDGNVFAGTTDEGSSGGVDHLSVDGSRVLSVTYDRNFNGTIEDTGVPATDEVLDVPVPGPVTFDARFGTFSMFSNGNYTYDGDVTTAADLQAAFPGANVYDEVFQYTAIDGDGDTSSAFLTVRIDAFSGDRSNNDYYIGSMFADTFDAGAGDDILRGRGGDDTLNGGTGIDLLDFSDATGAITFTLQQGPGPFSTGAQPGAWHRHLQQHGGRDRIQFRRQYHGFGSGRCAGWRRRK